MDYTIFFCISWCSSSISDLSLFIYLFILCAEILGIAIRQTKDIKEFCYKRKEIKLSQYADDTQILLDGSEKSVRNTVKDWEL